MKRAAIIGGILLAALAAPGSVARAARPRPGAGPERSRRGPASSTLPRYRFVNYPTANGLPNNHVYSVLVARQSVV